MQKPDNFLTEEELRNYGFKRVGRNVKISRKASVYTPELIELGDNVRIDDFCAISGRIVFGNFVHITVFCLLAGGPEGIFFGDFTTLAYRCTVFTRSDDYTGLTLANSTVPEKYRFETISLPVYIKKHAIVGANSVVFPGAHIEEGVSIGACSLVTKATEPWGIYFGVPAERKRERSKNLLVQEKELLAEWQ